MLQFNMNTSKSSSTKSVPFEIFFNKKPNFGNKKQFMQTEKDGSEVPCNDLIENPSTSTASTSSEEVDKEVEAEDEVEEEDVEEDELAIEIEKKRTLLNENKKKNADMMVRKHDHKRNKKSTEYKIGDCVSIKIPRIDRTGAAFARLPGMICKIANHKQQFYRIFTEWGILNDKYLASSLEFYSGVVNVSLDEYESKFSEISLSEAARLQGLSTGANKIVARTCKCKGVCKNDGRCSCWANGEKCGSHCHLNLKSNEKKKCKNC